MMMSDLKNFGLITPGIHLSDSSGIGLLKEVRGNGNETKKDITFLIISSEEKKIYFEELKKFQQRCISSKECVPKYVFSRDTFGL
jgi:hypothetical protein